MAKDQVNYNSRDLEEARRETELQEEWPKLTLCLNSKQSLCLHLSLRGIFISGCQVKAFWRALALDPIQDISIYMIYIKQILTKPEKAYTEILLVYSVMRDNCKILTIQTITVPPKKIKNREFLNKSLSKGKSSDIEGMFTFKYYNT